MSEQETLLMLQAAIKDLEAVLARVNPANKKPARDLFLLGLTKIRQAYGVLMRDKSG